MDYLEISEAYDAARRIVGKLEGQAAGTAIWYKLDHIDAYLRNESQKAMKAHLAEDER